MSAAVYMLFLLLFKTANLMPQALNVATVVDESNMYHERTCIRTLLLPP